MIIGSGAAGLAFADTLIDESSAHITIVDRHGKPGGHWNDAYSFVTLHEPSAFYGVNSLALGTSRKDTVGANKGLYELASGAEVSGYFDRVMNQKLQRRAYSVCRSPLCRRRHEEPPVWCRAFSRQPGQLPPLNHGQHDEPVPMVSGQGPAQLDP